MRDTEKEGRSKEGMQERRDAGEAGCRKGEMQKVRVQERRDTVKNGFRTGGIHDRRDT